MIRIQHSSTKPAIKPFAKQIAKQIMPLSQETVFGCVAVLARTGLSGWNLLGRGLAIVGLSFESERGLFIDSSDYINRLGPTRYRSGERRRLAAIPL